MVKAKNIIIATGSLPKTINIDNEKDKVIFAQDLFSSIKEEDENFLIIGGSIGIETTSLLNWLEKIGIEKNSWGGIKTNAFCRQI